MKLLTFEHGGKEDWGVLYRNPDTGVDYVLLPDRAEKLIPAIATSTSSYTINPPVFLGEDWPDSLAGFLALEERGMATLQRLYDFFSDFLTNQDSYMVERCALPLSQVKIKAPIPQPRLVWGLVQNTPSFVRNQPGRIHSNHYPQGHQRPMTCVVGMGEEVLLSPRATRVGYNVELGVVIGKKGREIPAHLAHEYVAGFTNVLDITPDDVNLDYDRESPRVGKKDFFIDATASWGSKKMDTNSPMGPYLVTRDEVPNPYNLLAYTKMNGMVRDRAHTSAQLLGYERTIAFYSSFATLYPGDIIHLGTVGVDGMTYTLDGAREGDTFGGEFERLGELTVPMRRLAPGDDRVAPVVGDLIRRQQDALPSPKAFAVSEVRNFFVSYGNYKGSEAVEGLVCVDDVPRFLNHPGSALTAGDEAVRLPRIATDLAVSAELCCVVGKVARHVPPEQAGEYILGYSPMAAVTDRSLVQSIIEPATAQERSLPLVYGRWGDGYNRMLAHPIPLSRSPRDVVSLEIDGAGSLEVDWSEYICGCEALLSTISRYITLLPGDVLSLGRTAQQLIVPADHKEITGRVASPTLGTVTFRLKR
ncbi:fumarylacetoacetate hydrolase family protein [Ruminococcaceae bacterium OttesenSCG-928-L11]|nr:fumarylacetoacetate hydrolase family protein [Ruminococcaceae bacterium OttesenSCG-928-L11]